MDVGSDRALVAAWWDYWRRSQGSRTERKELSLGQPPEAVAAYETVARVMDDGGPAAVELLVALTDAQPFDDNGITVGCGPLEDLLHDHGDSLSVYIDEHARRSPAFALALSHVWLSRGQLSETAENLIRPWIPSLNR